MSFDSLLYFYLKSFADLNFGYYFNILNFENFVYFQL